MIPIQTSQVMYYWGEGGSYGPFALQTDGDWVGWPDFGQVLRYFRKKAKLSAKAFGERYGKVINADGSAIGERWILDMELQNKVPVDIGRRKTLAKLLNIPPMLFGLAVLEDMTLEPQQYRTTTGQTKLTRVGLDTAMYQKNIRSIWHLHETSNAQQMFQQVEIDMQSLKLFEKQTEGDLRYQIQEMLFSNFILATHITRDTRNFEQAHFYANETVRIAKDMKEHDLIATALFTRGWNRLEWGIFGTMRQNTFVVQQEKISAAIRDFQSALDLFPLQDGNEQMHPQLLGILTGEMMRAKAVLATSRKMQVSSSILTSIDTIEETVGKQHIADPYSRLLLKGDRGEWHEEAYRSIRAAVFDVAGLPGSALKEINALDQLTEKTHKRDETRRFVWRDIQRATVLLKLEEFGEATKYAMSALLASQDINSITNIAIVTDIYGRLLTTRYKDSRDVEELGNLLRTSPIILLD
jgi:hypothetical protein